MMVGSHSHVKPATGIRRTSSVGMADALIAATAIQHRLTLVTRNGSDFAPLAGIRVRMPS